MRHVIAVVALTSLLAACGDGAGGGGSPTPAPPTATRVAEPTTTPSSPEASAVAGAGAEVTGIVGAVSSDRRTIEITRVSGAQVHEVQLTGATVVRRAGGGRMSAAEIRPSDRIIAEGNLDASATALVADEVTVQAVVSGGAPGG